MYVLLLLYAIRNENATVQWVITRLFVKDTLLLRVSCIAASIRVYHNIIRYLFFEIDDNRAASACCACGAVDFADINRQPLIFLLSMLLPML